MCITPGNLLGVPLQPTWQAATLIWITTTLVCRLALGEHEHSRAGCLEVDSQALCRTLESASEVIERVSVHAVASGDVT